MRDASIALQIAPYGLNPIFQARETGVAASQSARRCRRARAGVGDGGGFCQVEEIGVNGIGLQAALGEGCRPGCEAMSERLSGQAILWPGCSESNPGAASGRSDGTTGQPSWPPG